MLNQKTFESLYNYYFDEEIEHDDESEEELYHHGVLGQSWGKKHGPPYPLDGVDKKIARAEAKKKKERERKLKKMQRAAKKARKVKQREEKKQEDILKKKQKLMKKGDMQAIKKNSHLFTNEELAYIMDRENLKKGFKDKKERTDDEKMELFMKRFGQIANIASSAEAVFKMAKAGTDVYKSLKETKVKELEAEDKRMSALKSEFEMRFQGDERSSAEAKQFIDDRVNGRDYKTPKETKIEKKERKMVEDARSRQVDQYYKDMEAADKAEKQAKKAEKQKRKDEKIAKREEKKNPNQNKEEVRRGINDVKKNKPKILNLDNDDKWTKAYNDYLNSVSKEVDAKRVENIFAKNDAKVQWGESNSTWTPSVKTAYTSGKDWSNSFFSSDWSGPTYQSQVGYKVTPKKVKK